MRVPASFLARRRCLRLVHNWRSFCAAITYGAPESSPGLLFSCVRYLIVLALSRTDAYPARTPITDRPLSGGVSNAKLPPDPPAAMWAETNFCVKTAIYKVDTKSN